MHEHLLEMMPMETAVLEMRHPQTQSHQCPTPYLSKHTCTYGEGLSAGLQKELVPWLHDPYLYSHLNLPYQAQPGQFLRPKYIGEPCYFGASDFAHTFTPYIYTYILMHHCLQPTFKFATYLE